jgi:SAM-dependent methyltransferase
VPSLDLTGLAKAVLAVGPAPERALEIECGEGEGVLFLTREYPRARVRGVDSSEEAIAAAVARTGLDPEGRVAFRAAAPDRLPFPDDHFDLVVQRQGRLSPGELARVLRPGGTLLFPARSRARGPLGLPLDAGRGLARHGFGPGAEAGGVFLLSRLPGPGDGPGPQ